MEVRSNTCVELNLQLNASLRDIIERAVARKSAFIISQLMAKMRGTDTTSDEVSRSQEKLIMRVACSRQDSKRLEAAAKSVLGG